MGPIGLKLLHAFLKFAGPFVPRKKYQAEVDAILEMDEKNEGYDLRDWEYRKVPSTDQTWSHRFYHLPSAKKDAPPLLLLHGLNLDGRTFRNMKELAKEYELIAFDWPESSDLYHGRMEDYVLLLDDFIEVMGLESVSIAGVSLGGMIAQLYAARHPAPAVRAVILVSTRIPGYFQEALQVARLTDDMIRSLEDYQLFWILERIGARFLNNLEPQEREDMIPILRQKKLAFIRQASRALRDYDGGIAAQRIEQPVLSLLGTKDELMELESVADLRESIPHVKIELIRDGNHTMAYLKGELIAECIGDFLRAHS